MNHVYHVHPSQHRNFGGLITKSNRTTRSLAHTQTGQAESNLRIERHEGGRCRRAQPLREFTVLAPIPDHRNRKDADFVPVLLYLLLLGR
jgi:hypothetical protein